MVFLDDEVAVTDQMDILLRCLVMQAEIYENDNRFNKSFELYT